MSKKLLLAEFDDTSPTPGWPIAIRPNRNCSMQVINAAVTENEENFIFTLSNSNAKDTWNYGNVSNVTFASDVPVRVHFKIIENTLIDINASRTQFLVNYWLVEGLRVLNSNETMTVAVDNAVINNDTSEIISVAVPYSQIGNKEGAKTNAVVSMAIQSNTLGGNIIFQEYIENIYNPCINPVACTATASHGKVLSHSYFIFNLTDNANWPTAAINKVTFTSGKSYRVHFKILYLNLINSGDLKFSSSWAFTEHPYDIYEETTGVRFDNACKNRCINHDFSECVSNVLPYESIYNPAECAANNNIVTIQWNDEKKSGSYIEFQLYIEEV